MQFSQFSTPKKSWRERFFDQPHQPFFIASFFFAFVTIFGTFLSFLGKDVNFGLFHGFGLIFGVFTNAFLGFLFTVIPRYCASSPIEQKSYTFVWVLYQTAVLLVLFEFMAIGKLFCALLLLYSVKIFYTNIKEGYGGDNKESYILTLLLFWGALMLISEVLFDTNLSVLLFYSYLLGIVYLVALRMIPNFYSGYTQKPKWQKPKYILDISLLFIFSIGFTSQFEMLLAGKIVALVSLLFFGYVIYKLDIYSKTPVMLSILVISFYWFYLAVFVHFIETIFEIYTFKLSFHIFALGFILNLLIGFGTRVTLAHAIPPQRVEADKFTVALFILTQVVIVTRILGSLFFLGGKEIFIDIFYLSLTLWILLFFGWCFRYSKFLLRY